MNFSRRLAIILLTAFIFLISMMPVLAATKEKPGVKEIKLRPRTAHTKSSISEIPQDNHSYNIIVKFIENAGIKFRNGRLISTDGQNLGQANGILNRYFSHDFKRLFDSFTEAKLNRKKEQLQYRSGAELADLNTYFQLSVTSAAEAKDIIDQLNDLETVEIAYYEPAVEPAGDIDPPTPDYEASQDYLEAAPTGIDSYYARTQTGGDGTGVKIIDIEGAWVTTHEDLDKAVNGMIGGAMFDNQNWRDHGSAVLGELIATDNGYGVTGICPGADIGMVGVAGISTSHAILMAVDSLQSGDIILIELHAPGPRFNFNQREDQKGYVCMEYWSANFDAMSYAWAMGITVVEPAGNGAEDFDDPIYEQRFDTTFRNSHAIIVGAGYQAASANDLQRISFSNYGERVNLQGYGSGVFTAGYGSLFNGNGDENQYYTANFGGTSSASPIIAGAVACLQGYFKATYGTFLDSDHLRDLLVNHGTPQAGNTAEHIGPRPDLNASINAALGPPSLYSIPFAYETVMDQGGQETFDLWLFNRSTVDKLNYIIDKTNSGGNWLNTSKTFGSVYPSDSTLIVVTLDAEAVLQSSLIYDGLLEIFWSRTSIYDSITYVPIYMEVPCNDSSMYVLTSDDPGGPALDWISAKTLGTRIDINSYYNDQADFPEDDGSAGPFGLGFSFPFYNEYYDSFYVGVNGAISFTQREVNLNGYFGYLNIPGSFINDVVSPFWNDLIIDVALVPEAGIYLYTVPTMDTTVIEWYHPANFNAIDDTTANFEIVITADGNISCQYLSLGSSGIEETAVIGVSHYDCQSLSYYNNGDIPENLIAPNQVVQFNTYFEFVRTGDANQDGILDIDDLIIHIEYMFGDGPPPVPNGSGDADCSDQIDIDDLVYLVEYMFGFPSGPDPCTKWLYLP